LAARQRGRSGRAQQSDRLRRVGALGGLSEADRQAGIGVFRETLAKLGWVENRNLRIDLRFTGNDVDLIRVSAAELVTLSPDVIVTAGRAAIQEAQRLTRTIPIVITGGGDPAFSGFVKNIAHPEGNVTGITNLYASIGGKWLEVLKQAVPTTETVGLIVNPQLNAGGSAYIPSIEEAARSLRIKLVRLPYQDAIDLTHGIEGFAAEANAGLIVLPPPPTTADRAVIRRLAVQHRLPTIWQERQYALEGGLLAYGSNDLDRWRRACSFVDRILRGAKVSELPLEFPTKFELAVNLKAAKAIGLTIPENFLLRADELFE
jgi:putative ABC transport system substrate-binding protein